jgi:hypothetical protein
MTRQANGIAIPLRGRAWCRSVLVAGAVLVALASSASSASATLTGDVVESVGSTVESVETVPQAAPVPSAVPPAPVPSAVPPAPPVAPQPSPQVQPEAATTPSRSADEVPVSTKLAGVAKNAVGSVAGSGAEARRQAPASVVSDDGDSYSNGSTPVSSKTADRAARAVPSAPPSIGAAKEAPLHRWLARVWPAISLGGGDRGWLAGPLATLLRPAVAAAARMGSVIPSNAPVARDFRPVAKPDSASAARPTSPDAAASIEGGKAFYFVALAALSVLLAFTIWREFRAALRPGVH